MGTLSVTCSWSKYGHSFCHLCMAKIWIEHYCCHLFITWIGHYFCHLLIVKIWTGHSFCHLFMVKLWIGHYFCHLFVVKLWTRHSITAEWKQGLPMKGRHLVIKPQSSTTVINYQQTCLPIKKPFQETRAPKHDFSGNLRLLSGMHHIGWFQSLETLPWGFLWIFVSCRQRQIPVHEGCHQKRLHSCCFKHKRSFLLREHRTDWRARPLQFCI